MHRRHAAGRHGAVSGRFLRRSATACSWANGLAVSKYEDGPDRLFTPAPRRTAVRRDPRCGRSPRSRPADLSPIPDQMPFAKRLPERPPACWRLSSTWRRRRSAGGSVARAGQPAPRLKLLHERTRHRGGAVRRRHRRSGAGQWRRATGPGDPYDAVAFLTTQRHPAASATGSTAEPIQHNGQPTGRTIGGEVVGTDAGRTVAGEPGQHGARHVGEMIDATR